MQYILNVTSAIKPKHRIKTRVKIASKYAKIPELFASERGIMGDFL